jgi:hypothetical protein
VQQGCLCPWLIFLQVVLVANDMPTINDITYEELVQVVSKVSFLIIQLDARFRLKVLS